MLFIVPLNRPLQDAQILHRAYETDIIIGKSSIWKSQLLNEFDTKS